MTPNAAAVFGQAVTLKATVAIKTPGAGTVTGSVDFYDGSVAGGNLLGSGLINAGIATASASNLAVGSHTIIAVYSGDANNATSTSTGVAQAIVAAPTSVTLTSTAAPSVFGQSVTFNAAVHVSALSTASPDGLTVSFYNIVGTTNVLMGTGAVVAGVASFPVSTLTVGRRTPSRQW